MSRWLIALLFVSATAHAAPPELRDDDMNQLLVNRSLISQLREARHHMAERTSDFVKEARQSVAEKTSDLVVTAMGFIGVPYRRGGNSAETGFDCSGFVRAIYSETLGKVLPRRADQQAQATEKSTRTNSSPAIWCSSTPCAAPSATSASMSATATSFMPPHRCTGARGKHAKRLLGPPLRWRPSRAGLRRPGPGCQQGCLGHADAGKPAAVTTAGCLPSPVQAPADAGVLFFRALHCLRPRLRRCPTGPACAGP